MKKISFILKYNFNDKLCENFAELTKEVETIKDGSCFSIVDKRGNMNSVIFLDKKSNKLFESYGEEKFYDLESLNT